MKKMRGLKRGLALFLVTVLVLGCCVCIPNLSNKVNAEGGLSPAYDISKNIYATKEQLMNEFSVDGTSYETVGKIYFGTDVEDNNSKQAWYIVGNDTGITGDNINLFAVDNIGEKTLWGPVSFPQSDALEDYNEYYDYLSYCYYNGSNLQSVIDSMVQSHFSTAEQRYMNITELNNKIIYDNDGFIHTLGASIKESFGIPLKIDAILYPVVTDFDYDYEYQERSSANMVLRLGSDMSSNVKIEPYVWNKGEDFFLRDYYFHGGEYSERANAAYFDVDAGVDTDNCDTLVMKKVTRGSYTDDDKYGIRPAFNLNLTDVLFASAVPNTSLNSSGDIDNTDPVMTLRFTDNNVKIGQVIYDGNNIIAIKDHEATDDVRLVIQGNEAGGDWYYTKEITGTSVIALADIRSEMGIYSDFYFRDDSKCRIWLETVDDDGMIYAINPIEENINTINNIEITDIIEPQANLELDESAVCATIGITETTPTVTYTKENASVTEDKADWSTVYIASVTLTPNTSSGYIFANNVSATINGNVATDVTKNSDGTITVKYQFPATEARPVYNLTEGADSIYEKDSGDSLIIKGDGPRAKFRGIRVNGVELDAADYEVEDDETEISISERYLSNLAPGQYSIMLLWEDGYVETNITIKSEQQSSEQQSSEQQSNEQQSNEQQSNEQQSNEQQSNEQQSNEQQSNEKQSNEQQSSSTGGSETETTTSGGENQSKEETIEKNNLVNNINKESYSNGGNNDVVTGDNANVFISILMLAGAAGVVLLIGTKRKTA